MQSMSAVQLQNFNRPRRTFDERVGFLCQRHIHRFTVKSGTFLAAAGTSCDGSQADYAKVQSTVDWAATSARR